MRRVEIPRKTDQTWIVTSGGRLLSASLRHPLATAHPHPRPAPARVRARPYRRGRYELVPLSRRPAFDDR